MIYSNTSRDSGLKIKIKSKPIAEDIIRTATIVDILKRLDAKNPSVLVIIEAIKLKISLEKEETPNEELIFLIKNAIKKHEPLKWLPPIYW